MYVFNICQYLGGNFENPPLKTRYLYQYLGAFDQYFIKMPNQYLGDFNQYDGVSLPVSRSAKDQ